MQQEQPSDCSLITVAMGTITSPLTTSKGQNKPQQWQQETEPVRAYREQARSAKGTAGMLAKTTKGVQPPEERESLRAWGRAEERGLSPDGKHPHEEQSQTRKHQNIHSRCTTLLRQNIWK